MSGIPVGLDFGAIMAVAAAQDADLELIAETLPEFEIVILSSEDGQSEEE